MTADAWRWWLAQQRDLLSLRVPRSRPENVSREVAAASPQGVSSLAWKTGTGAGAVPDPSRDRNGWGWAVGLQRMRHVGRTAWHVVATALAVHENQGWGARPWSPTLRLDENRRNNRPENLRWGTQRENLHAPGFLVYCRSRLGAENPYVKGRARKATVARHEPVTVF
jgi:hypothetical protein